MKAAQLVSDERGPFLNTPLDDQIAECERWLADGGRPESHPATRGHTQRPPEGVDMTMLAPVSVSKVWADQTPIQCNICGNASKFEQNGHIASYPDGWWYVIGPQCGSAEHLARAQRGINARLHRESRKLIEAELRTLVDDLPRWKTFASELRQAVDIADRAARFLSTKMPRLYANIDSASRSADWKLTVIASVKRVDQWGDEQSYREFVPHVSVSAPGAVHFSSSITPKFKSAFESLTPYLEAPETLDVAIVGASQDRTLPVFQRELRKHLDDLRATHRALGNAKQFWTAQNWAVIADWAKRSDSGYDQNVLFAFKGDALEFVTEHGDDWKMANFGVLTRYSATPPT